MTVTRKDVADLMPGDVVEFRHPDHPAVVIQGPLHEDGGGYMCLGDFIAIRLQNGNPSSAVTQGELTVIQRAPRPLYVNHPRSEPVPGDVVRSADDKGDRSVFVKADSLECWFAPSGVLKSSSLPKRLRLLVDGETGQVVPHE